MKDAVIVATAHMPIAKPMRGATGSGWNLHLIPRSWRENTASLCPNRSSRRGWPLKSLFRRRLVVGEGVDCFKLFAHGEFEIKAFGRDGGINHS